MYSLWLSCVVTKHLSKRTPSATARQGSHDSATAVTTAATNDESIIPYKSTSPSRITNGLRSTSSTPRPNYMAAGPSTYADLAGAQDQRPQASTSISFARSPVIPEQHLVADEQLLGTYFAWQCPQHMPVDEQLFRSE